MKIRKYFPIMFIYFITLFFAPQEGGSQSSLVASFTADPVSGTAEAPLSVQFTDTSTGAPTSWLWNFGDGTSCTDQHPVVAYFTAGTYSVTLTVANDASEDSVTGDYLVSGCGNQFSIMHDSQGFDFVMDAITDAIGSGSNEIRLMAGTLLGEDLFFDDPAPIRLRGGFDCSFVDDFLLTSIPGSITIAASSGPVTLSNVKLTPGPLCDPGDPNNFPGNLETCDGLDNNCDGVADDGLTFDVDGDGFSSIGSCLGSADDCNDNDAGIHPGATEFYGDWIDQNCDGDEILSVYDYECFDCHGYSPSLLLQINMVHTNCSTPDTTCVNCHAAFVENILPAHYGRKVRSAGNNMVVGQVIFCTSCHDREDGEDHSGANMVWPKVLAVGMGNETCDTCHEYYADAHATATAHNNRTISSSCACCHTSDTATLGSPGNGSLTTAANVDTLHRSDCTLCHNYTGTKVNPAIVRQAIEDGMDGFSVSCGDCHIDRLTGHGIPSVGKHLEHFALFGESCDLCHGTNPPPLFADGQDLTQTSVCNSCHRDAAGNPAIGFKEGWADESYKLGCDGCHEGRPNFGEFVMSSNGHERLVGEDWIRQYPCWYCHYDTVSADWELKAKHANGLINIAIDPRWNIVGEGSPSYDEQTKVCSNLYCHTDGTTVDPEKRAYPWTDGHKNCNACHGHTPSQTCSTASCHQNEPGKAWSDEQRWLSAMPMYENSGPGTPKANAHFRHLFTGFSCDDCHVRTVKGGACIECHNGVDTSSPTSGNMVENAHVDEDYHVNRIKDVYFKDGGTYDPVNKSCSSTACHTGGTDVFWGDSVNDGVVCIDCHGTTGDDVDDFGAFNGVRAKISKSQWDTKGHGRPTGSGNYPQSGNPPANFPNNGCWYCHDNQVLHQDDSNPFRLRQHQQFANRFEKECVYCHMSGNDSECLNCHNDADGESLAPQLATIGELTGDEPRPDHTSWVDGLTSCRSGGCHEDDASTHKTDAGLWSQSEKEDIKNSYLMMGVCLKCHDDDSSGECASCHVRPDDDPATPEIDEQAQYDKKYALGFDPGLPGLGFIKPQQAKASSFHFGYKHYEDYEDSLGDPPLDSGSVDMVSTSTGQIIDSTKVGVWEDNQYSGRRVTVTSGVNAGLTRPIVRNTVEQIEVDSVLVDVEVITVFPPFPDDQQLALGDTYEIMDHVWKGGKFCWDCHDPHGDGNIFMIQDMVATRTDGEFGKPISRASVEFTKKQIGTDYARTTAPYNGICNVCHSQDSKHYTKVAGDGHQTGRVCTTCHEHRFTDSHSSGKACNSCHQNKPVPRHTAFGLPRDCTKCHQGAILNRMDIMGQFQGNSHHIQDVEVENTHCYACHWEATADGLINVEHHEGYNYKTHESTPNAKVDLVIWGPGDPDEDGIPTGADDNKTLGSRPIVYDPFGTDPDGPGVPTATTFLASNIHGSLAEQRQEVENITPHCLGCHSDQNNDTEPFNDCKTPRQYAWDFSSVDSRYNNTTTAPWGKYTAKITKAFSAHGNAKNNGGGFDPSTGIDGTVPNTRAGNYNVHCFDCHSSHGSYVSGITSNYTTFNGTKNGGNLKETQAGKGGYLTSYKASSNIGSPDPNQYAAGAGQCFDCHESETAGATPWGYNSTFGATEPIMGYFDTPRFGNGKNGSETRFPYKDRPNHMGHYGVSAELQNPAEGQINGLCTPCHDPHGVSKAFGADMEYALPLLTGTWLTTPYTEDAAAKAKPETPWEGNYRGKVPVFDVPAAGVQLNETVQQFAGLCLKCHPQSSLSPDIDTTWASSDRIHDTVQGWGSPRHSYSCSKCHTPHANRLPRLLVTNCLDGNHSGQVVSGGTTSDSDWGEPDPSWECYDYDECGGSGSGNWNQGGFGEGWGWDPGNVSYTVTGPVAGCHDNPATPRLDDKRSWNNVSQW